MDAVTLTGVWLNFPGIRTQAHVKVAAGLYNVLMNEERRRREKMKNRPKTETPRETRFRLLREIERRIVERDNDDMVVLFTL